MRTNIIVRIYSFLERWTIGSEMLVMLSLWAVSLAIGEYVAPSNTTLEDTTPTHFTLESIPPTSPTLEEISPTNLTLEDITTLLASLPTSSSHNIMNIEGVEMEVKKGEDNHLIATIQLTSQQKAAIREMLQAKNKPKKKIPSKMTISGESLKQLEVVAQNVINEMKKHDLLHSGSEVKASVRNQWDVGSLESVNYDYKSDDYDTDENPLDILAEFSDIFGRKVGSINAIHNNDIKLQSTTFKPSTQVSTEGSKKTRKIVLNIRKTGKSPSNKLEVEDLKLPDEIDESNQETYNSDEDEYTTSFPRLTLSSSTLIPFVVQNSSNQVNENTHTLFLTNIPQDSTPVSSPERTVTVTENPSPISNTFRSITGPSTFETIPRSSTLETIAISNTPKPITEPSTEKPFFDITTAKLISKFNTLRPTSGSSTFKPTSFFSKKLIPTRKPNKPSLSTDNVIDRLTTAQDLKPTTFRPDIKLPKNITISSRRKTWSILTSSTNSWSPETTTLTQSVTSNITSNFRATTTPRSPNLTSRNIKETNRRRGSVSKSEVSNVNSTAHNTKKTNLSLDVKDDSLITSLPIFSKKPITTTKSTVHKPVTKVPFRTTESRNPIGSLNTFFQTGDLPRTSATPRLNTIIIDFHKHRHSDYDYNYDDYDEGVQYTTPLTPTTSFRQATSSERLTGQEQTTPFSFFDKKSTKLNDQTGNRAAERENTPTSSSSHPTTKLTSTTVRSIISDEDFLSIRVPYELELEGDVTTTENNKASQLTTERSTLFVTSPVIERLSTRKPTTSVKTTARVIDDASPGTVRTTTLNTRLIGSQQASTTTTVSPKQPSRRTFDSGSILRGIVKSATTSTTPPTTSTAWRSITVNTTLLNNIGTTATSMVIPEKHKGITTTPASPSDVDTTVTTIKAVVTTAATTEAAIITKAVSTAATTTVMASQSHESNIIEDTTPKISISNLHGAVSELPVQGVTHGQVDVSHFSRRPSDQQTVPVSTTVTNKVTAPPSIFSVENDRAHSNISDTVSSDISNHLNEKDTEQANRRGKSDTNKIRVGKIQNKTSIGIKTVGNSTSSGNPKKMSVSTSMFLPGISSSNLTKFDRLEAELMARQSKFECQKRNPGFYADIDVDCQIWYWCVSDGSKYAFICPEGTAFDQQQFICNWKDKVDCQDSPDFFHLNQDVQIEDNRL